MKQFKSQPSTNLAIAAAVHINVFHLFLAKIVKMASLNLYGEQGFWK